MIVDSSVVLMAFFPDEGHFAAQALIQAHVLNTVELQAPTLLPYEIANAALQAVRRGRITVETAQEILAAFENLNISLHPVPSPHIVTMARHYARSAYDAAYLSLAETLDLQLITGDRRLYNAVHPQSPRVLWIGDYRPPAV